MRSIAGSKRRGIDAATAAELIDAWNIIGPTAVPITDSSLLPPRLEHHVRTLRTGYFWRAWEDEGRVRFIVLGTCGLAVKELAHDRTEAYFFDGSARLLSAGIWSRVSPGRWQFVDRLEQAVAMFRHTRPIRRGKRPATPRKPAGNSDRSAATTRQTSRAR